MKNKQKLVQVSKENINGKWVKVAFYEDSKGKVTMKIIKK